MKTIQQVPLQQIDVSDETFSVNFMPDVEKLRSSIREVGMIEPVVLKKKGQGYQIVCGFRRMRLASELGISAIEARVFEEKERDDIQFFSISLHENATGRGFNAVEVAVALDKLVRRFQVSPSTVIQTFLPLFSLETNEKILNTFLSLARMEEDVKRYVVRERVSRTNIRRFSTLTPEDRTAVLSLISSLKLGENSLRETLTLLEEIAPREHRTIREIVDRPEIQAILSHEEFTPSQRTERVKKVLLHLRYPRMHQLEETFDEKAKALHLPAGLSVRHEPYFEGKGLRIELRFGTLEEYRSLLALISALPENEAFLEMLIEKT
jgi:ParB family chromosome partitioning protein